MIDEADLAEIWVRLDRARDSSFTTAAYVLAALIASVMIVKVRKQRQQKCLIVSAGLLQRQNIQHSRDTRRFTRPSHA